MKRFLRCRWICLLLFAGLVAATVLPANIVFGAEAEQGAGGDDAFAVVVESGQETAVRGETYRATVRFQGGTAQAAAAFRLYLNYEADFLTLRSIEAAPGMATSEFRYAVTENEATAVFASLSRSVSLADGVCCTLVFDVNEDAPVGSTTMTATADQVVATGLEKLPGTNTAGLTAEMARILSSGAVLASLAPSSGELTPVFSPEITEYTLSVPYEVTELTFAAEPADNATYRVNRKNLNSAGTPTTYTIKVTSEDGSSVTEYVITATRQLKAAAAGSTSSSGGSSGSSGSSGASASRTTSSRSASSASQKSSAANAGTTGAAAGTGQAQTNGGTTVYGSHTLYIGNQSGSEYLFLAILIVLCALCVLSVVRIKSSGSPRPSKRSRQDNSDYQSRH